MGRAVNEGLPEGVMFGLSDEHKVGEIQVPGAKGIGKDKERIEVSERWDQRHKTRSGGLQCPV